LQRAPKPLVLRKAKGGTIKNQKSPSSCKTGLALELAVEPVEGSLGRSFVGRNLRVQGSNRDRQRYAQAVAVGTLLAFDPVLAKPIGCIGRLHL
jgi:hypothetical protein